MVMRDEVLIVLSWMFGHSDFGLVEQDFMEESLGVAVKLVALLYILGSKLWRQPFAKVQY